MSAISNLPISTKIIMALIAMMTVWLFVTDSNKEQSNQQTIRHKTTDYAMSNFKITVIEDGSTARIITGKEMSHYSGDDTTEIIDPVAYFLEPKKDTWVVQSNKGTIQGKGEKILLTGNVIITRESDNETELRTEELTLNTENNTAYTDLVVAIKSQYGNTNSIGLHADLEDETINLHSKVKGHYDAPTTD